MREIRVKVIPNVRKESIVEAKDGRFVVSVNAPREEGRANERLCELCAEYFGVPLKNITLVRGHQQGTKTLRIT